LINPLLDLLRRLLPCELPGGELSLAGSGPPLHVDEAGTLFVVLRTLTREDGMIIDVREQERALGRFDAYPLARWQAYLEGTLRAAPAIVTALGGLDALFPCDLFAYPQLLDDPSLVSADDFFQELTDPEQLAAWNQLLQDEPWLELLEPCGLADRLDEVRALLRPSLRLHLTALEEREANELEVGSTHFGGDPDLPPALAWPDVDGEPMVFVAQLDLAEFADHEAASELPREGLLSFFYAPIPPDGYALEHPVAVLHLRDREVLERRPAPEPRDRLRLHAVSFEAEQLLPALESAYHYEALRPGAPIDYSALASLVFAQSDCDFERPTHRLLGHPASIQGDPYLDVEMSRRGWDGWGEGSDEAHALREQALRWRLLLQVDAYQDDELLLNQDGGFFYFWIPRDALERCDWSRVQGCLQCH
jgi:hypothetical protein